MNMFKQNNGYSNLGNMFDNNFEQQLQTNKWKVQNLQDALSRYSPPNSCGCYYCVLDNIEYEYEVYTDMNGQKTYKVFKRVPCETSTNQQTDLSEILDRLTKLEEYVTNAKPAANSTNGVK